ncbi:hypothetical protein U732_1099 [Clostridium argentinense CDC 2741]|uniref:Uncharacterized protein n=2 Tax=Clostridium argentinense TaxID=29341 RepID=A0A0C1R909_9CLOT|nr:hypothetical protein [Clostridium argentinense]ARC85661.1 hypothetical protein RSJ17_14670 [Clostridium argentinense]KIE46961.1 hypothetical protein U732_1099 [Clostridium argentinense CDC 2741]NFP50748.1 hypothetical protein [Clostridium argentinense]NFP73095.1 hypothetical protein [Clostridium argentinense]NFP77895.1 hypothetical protein [Clostridium argentinense]
MYFLRKESCEVTIPEIKMTDGTVIPERKYMTEDRALYKANGRFYRKEYSKPHQRGLKLYKVKKLSTILEQRECLYEYCGEWFDVYDENGKVDILKANEKRDEIDRLIDEGVSVYEIAEKYGGDYCVQDFGLNNELCHEDADCNNCWSKCLERRLNE